MGGVPRLVGNGIGEDIDALDVFIQNITSLDDVTGKVSVEGVKRGCNPLLRGLGGIPRYHLGPGGQYKKVKCLNTITWS